jgi:hypothetical protein
MLVLVRVIGGVVVDNPGQRVGFTHLSDGGKARVIDNSRMKTGQFRQAKHIGRFMLTAKVRKII